MLGSLFLLFDFFFSFCHKTGRSVIRSILVPWAQFYPLRLHLAFSFFFIRMLNQELLFPLPFHYIYLQATYGVRS